MKYLTFFKTSSDLYNKFADQIKNSNNIIDTTSSEKPKMEDNFLNEIMKNTQNIFYQNLSKFSKGLKQNIISKGPLSKLNEKSNKIESIKKTQYKKFHEIEDKGKKLQKKFMSYENLFSSFIQERNDSNNISNSKECPNLIDSPDFVYIIKDLIEEIRNLILKINLYVVNLKDDLLTINTLFVEINALVKESILIYIQESKIFFNAEVTKKFEEIENYFKKMEEKQKDNSFKLNKIFNEQKQKEDIFNSLKLYFELLNSSDKVKKELVSDKNAFSIEKYEDIISFFEWLISISPQPTDISVDDLINQKLEIKRDPGIFSKWRNSMIIFTKQNHIILFDKPGLFIIENIVKVFELHKVKFRKK